VITNTPDQVEVNQNSPSTRMTTTTQQLALLTFNLEHDLLKTAFASPEFINDELIIFSLDSSEKSTGYILSVSKGSTTVQQIYSTKNDKIINSLVGIGDYIFWVEYPRKSQRDTPWEIKTMKISDGSIQTFRKGVSEDEILPPVLRVSHDKLSWIEKKIENNVVLSTLAAYDSVSKKVTEVATIELDEKDKNKREGAFLNIQRPIEGGVLVHQSVFKRTDGESSKSYELVFYPYDQSTPILVQKDAQGIIDFTANEKWVVLCEIGKVKVIDRKSGEVTYEVPGNDSRLTFDSPFIMGNTLYFRYSMEQILILDLSTGKVKEVTKPRTTTSKIYNSADYLGFSYMKAVDPSNSGNVEFNIIGKSVSGNDSSN